MISDAEAGYLVEKFYKKLVASGHRRCQELNEDEQSTLNYLAEYYALAIDGQNSDFKPRKLLASLTAKIPNNQPDEFLHEALASLFDPDYDFSSFVKRFEEKYSAELNNAFLLQSALLTLANRTEHQQRRCAETLFAGDDEIGLKLENVAAEEEVSEDEMLDKKEDEVFGQINEMLKAASKKTLEEKTFTHFSEQYLALQNFGIETSPFERDSIFASFFYRLIFILLRSRRFKKSELFSVLTNFYKENPRSSIKWMKGGENFFSDEREFNSFLENFEIEIERIENVILSR